jgi:D-tyrosyl-tRNA(Tyr) deacylase
MKAVLQRVSRASVVVEGQSVGEIGAGLLVFLGVGAGDDKIKTEKLCDKIAKLRIFADENGKTNLSIGEVGGELLVVSQFTLYADCAKNRPSFSNAAPPTLAEELYEHFVHYARKSGTFAKVDCGVFGASMKVEIMNEGPFTILLET